MASEHKLIQQTSFKRNSRNQKKSAHFLSFSCELFFTMGLSHGGLTVNLSQLACFKGQRLSCHTHLKAGMMPQSGQERSFLVPQKCSNNVT